MQITLYRFGSDLEKAFLDQLVEPLQAVFGLSVTVIEEPVALPTSAFYAIREQWLARSLARALAGADPASEKERVKLGVTNVDLYTTGRNFVLGEALPEHRCAVVSVVRLDDRFYGYSHMDAPTFWQRFAAEAVHDVGHVMGLGHCPCQDCVMWSSNTLQEMDAKGWRMCEGCAAAVLRWQGRGIELEPLSSEPSDKGT